MTERNAIGGAAGAEERRLEELERVTREYGRYAQLAGLGVTALGAWLLVGALAPAGVSRWVLVAAPVVWALATSASARLHQRGAVVRVRGQLRGIALAMLYLCVLTLLLWVVVATRRQAGLERVGLIAAAGAFSAGILLVGHLHVRGVPDALFAWLALVQAIQALRGPPFRGLAWAAIWVALVAAGVYSHVQYRRLGRRIEALRGVP